ncbi:MAG: lamin tail domain-containing protein [Pirellulales bacterium]
MMANQQRHSGRSSARRRYSIETLEARQMLAANPIISEFVADNSNSLSDGDGRSSDWIELYNAGDAAIDLAGWHLTDDALLPTKWTFPSKTLDAGEFLVVFASSPTDAMGAILNDYVDAGGNLHTNFSLNNNGEYLALVRADLSVASEFAPAYPSQRADVSYGVGQGAIFTTLVDSGSAGKLLVPTASIGNTWTGGAEPFNDAAWQNVTLGVGYDEAPVPVTTLTNVALGKAVTQSTNGFGFNGSLAVDGNRVGNSISHTNTGDLEPWMEINLADDYDIERIDVYTRDNCCTPPVGTSRERDYNLVVEIRDAANAVLFTSTPFNPWDGTGNGATIVGVGASFTVDLTGEVEGGVTGRKVRVSKTAFGGANSSEWLHLAEVEVYAVTETTPVEENLALNKPTSGQVYSSFATSLGVDGNTGNFTHTDNVGAVFWQVDLQAATDLGRVELVNRGDGCCPERLDGAVLSILDAAQTPIYTADAFSGATSGQVFTFDNDGAGFLGARYIRVDHNNQYLSISEVRAFAPQGYNALIQTNIESSLKNVNSGAYLRNTFDVVDPTAFDQLTMNLNYDDGFVAYLNGTEFARSNAPVGTPAFNAAATAEHPGGLLQAFSVPLALLQSGSNVLAIHGLNTAAGDDDFVLRPKLVAREVPTGEVGFLPTPTPGQPNGTTVAGFVADTSFDVDRGFFDAAFDVNITSSTPGATIVYTTNGSAPTLTNGTQVPAADAATPPVATVHVTTTTTLRAAAFKTGFEQTNVDTQSYIFLQDVIHQPANPAGFPSTWSDGSTTIAGDYQMDPDVVGNPLYSDEIIQGLRDIPTISIVMDPDDLFGAQNGIYTNSNQRGSAWERATSVEIIDPSGASYQGNSGIRIHGFSWRFHSNSPKHGFRLEFRSEYGPSKLEYPLFPDAPVTKFDSIVLRQQGGRAWAGQQNPAEAQYLRDTYARDLAREMGKTDGHATLVHLYLNGIYWGLYNPVERPDANMGEEYFGGTDADYDALNRRTSTNEAIDGDLVRYNEMIAIANSALSAGVTTDAQLADLERYLDMEDFIDHLILNQFVTNRDGITAFDGNNQRAIGSRVGDAKFRFFVWDMEYSMWNATDNIHICQGCNNPAQAGGQNPPSSFWTLFKALNQHPEFRLRYADHVHQHLFNDGALTPTNSAATWEVRAQSIERAIIAESARWGDAKRATPYTRDVEWQAERNRLLTTYFPQRAGILTGQLQAAGLYAAVGAPEYFVEGTPQHGGDVTAGDSLALQQTDQVSYIDTPLINAATQVSAIVPTLAIHNAIGTDWRDRTYSQGDNGETWTTGTNGVGYDLDTNPATNYDSRINIDVEAQMSGGTGNTSVYVRIPFNIPNQAALDSLDFLTLRMIYDDGFVAYLNGTKVASAVAPADASLTWNSGATSGGEASLANPIPFDITAFRNQLIVGQNVLAIHGLNAGNNSSDMLIWAELLAREVDTTPTATPVYYTTDGSDPRLFGGAISPTATLYSGPLTLDASLQIRSRALTGGEWSAISETLFTVNVPLRVTEVMYNPDGPGDELEFIELVNASANTISLASVRFAGDDQGIEFTFDAGEATLSPGEFVVVARDRAAFEAAYDTSGIRLAIGQFAGGQQLANGGETLTLVDAAGGLIQKFTFDDDWFKETDGDGFSLVALDTAGNYDAATNWRSSALHLGSPGRADPTPAPGDFNGDGVTDRGDAALLAANFGRTTDSHRGRGDFNLDGATNLADLSALQAAMGSAVASPAASPSASAAAIVAEAAPRLAAHDRAVNELSATNRGNARTTAAARRTARSEPTPSIEIEARTISDTPSNHNPHENASRRLRAKRRPIGTLADRALEE